MLRPEDAVFGDGKPLKRKAGKHLSPLRFKDEITVGSGAVISPMSNVKIGSTTTKV